MKNVFKEILAEKQFEALPPFVERQLPFEPPEDKVFSVIGVRRAGKTTIFRQIYEAAKRQGLHPSEDLLSVNFFDERLSTAKGAELGVLLDAHAELYPERQPNTALWLFLDEIQVIPDWALFVSRMLRRVQTRIFLSGSSAKMLSKEIATQMRGRSVSIEVFPFSFEEYLHFHAIPISASLPEDRAKLIAALRRYLFEGAFPETFKKPPVLQRQILQEYYDVMLFRDVIERNSARSPNTVRAVLRILVNQISNFYTINKLCAKLKSLGNSAQKETISEYISWFEDSFLLYSVPIFSPSQTKQLVNPRKLYCVDNGLLRTVSFSLEDNRGVLLENAVFVHLRRKAKEIFYYKTRKGYELDFVVVGEKKELRLIQVSENLREQKVRAREIRALSSAMQELDTRQGLIVTLDDPPEEIKVESGTISIKPLWRFLLERVLHD